MAYALVGLSGLTMIDQSKTIFAILVLRAATVTVGRAKLVCLGERQGKRDRSEDDHGSREKRKSQLSGQLLSRGGIRKLLKPS